MSNRNNFIGLSGFVWWVGVIESRIDPLGVGRCQVRIFGWHTEDTSALPTEDLPWAHPMLSINNSKSVQSPRIGDWVVGFFMDGESAQSPIMMGVLPGLVSTNSTSSAQASSNIVSKPNGTNLSTQTNTNTTSSTTAISGKLVNGQPSGTIIYNGQTINPGDAGYAAASAALIAELRPSVTTTVVPSGTNNFNGF